MPHAATLSPLCSFGHVASYAELLEAFHGQESAIMPFRMHGGTCGRLRNGLYVCAHLSESERLAAWCGGQLDCLTVLAELGLPVADSGEPHLRLPRGHGRVWERRAADAPLTHAHWSRLRFPLPSVDEARWSAAGGTPLDRLRTPWQEALRQAMTTCLSYTESADVLETMLRCGYSADDLARVLASTPRRVQLAMRRLVIMPREIRDAFDAFTHRNLF
jgi:hypothetical protein